MKCFNHTSNEAVGICKNCGKAVCLDCIQETKNGIACSSVCLEEIDKVNSLIEKNMGTNGKTSAALNRNALIYIILGIGFIYFGFEDDMLFLKIMGALLLVGAGITRFSANSYRK